MGNIGKTAKIELLVILAPLNGVFGGNFTPYPQEGDIRDISGQNWKFQIFVPFSLSCVRRGYCLTVYIQSVFSPGPMYLTASEGILHTYLVRQKFS